MERGDLLFTIDPRPFEARVQQARAALARDQAQLENARRTRRAMPGSWSRGSSRARNTTRPALAATVRADRAQVEEARIELGHTSIRAPMTGRTGNLLVHEGNVVKPDETALVEINRIEPVFVSFSVPEEQLGEVRRHQAETPLTVDALAAAGAEPIARGTLTFIDNRVDPASSTRVSSTR